MSTPTKRQFGDGGLGTSIAQGLAERMSGTTLVTTTPDVFPDLLVLRRASSSTDHQT